MANEDLSFEALMGAAPQPNVLGVELGDAAQIDPLSPNALLGAPQAQQQPSAAQAQPQQAPPITPQSSPIGALPQAPLDFSVLGTDQPYEGTFSQPQRDTHEATAYKTDPIRKARQLGVITNDTPMEIGYMFEMLPEDYKIPGAKAIADKHFAEKYPDLNADVPIRRGPSKELEYRDPVDNKWHLFDEAGIDVADATRFLQRDVLPTLAGVGGFAAAGPVGGFLADAGTAAAVRATEVEVLKSKGILPPRYSTAGEAATAGATNAAGYLIGGVIGKGVSRLTGAANNIPINVTKKDAHSMRRMLAEYDASKPPELADVNPTAGNKLAAMANTPQEKSLADLVLSREREVIRDSRVAFERDVANRESVVGGMRETLDATTHNESSLLALGMDQQSAVDLAAPIVRELTERQRAALGQVDLKVAEAYTDASREAAKLVDTAVDPTNLNPSIHPSIASITEVYDNKVDEMYSAIRSEVGSDPIVDIAPMRNLLDELHTGAVADEKVMKQLFGHHQAVRQKISTKGDLPTTLSAEPLSQPESVSMFGNLFGTSQGSNLVLPAGVLSGPAGGSTKLNYKGVDTALKAIRRKKREVGDTQVGKALIPTLNKMENTLYGMRAEALTAKSPELADRQVAADAAFRVGRELIGEGVGKNINELFRPATDALTASMTPSSFRKLFLGDPGLDNARALQALKANQILRDSPGAPSHLANIDSQVKDAFLGHYKQKVFRAAGPEGRTIVDPDAHAKYMDEFGASMKQFFSPEEIGKFNNASSAKQLIVKREKDLTEVRKSLAKYPWGKADIVDEPSKMFRLTWGANKFDNSVKLLDELDAVGGSTAESLKGNYRGLIARDMFDGKKGFINDGNLNPDALDAYLRENESLIVKWFDGTQGQTGEQFVKRLRTYGEIARQVEGRTSVQGTAETNQFTKTLAQLSRSVVGVFTAPGRALTAGVQVLRGQENRQMIDFALNPSRYLANERYQLLLDSPAFKGAQNGAGHLIYETLVGGQKGR